MVVRGGSKEFCSLKALKTKEVKSASSPLYYLNHKAQVIFEGEEEVAALIHSPTTTAASWRKRFPLHHDGVPAISMAILQSHSVSPERMETFRNSWRTHFPA